jgi:hypothetical protein
MTLYPDGAVSHKTMEKNEVVSRHFCSPHGIATRFERLPSGQIETIGRTIYPNGDIAYHTAGFAGPQPVITFYISNAHPDPSLAGRMINGVRWAVEKVEVGPMNVEWALWTTGDSEDDRLFRDYVLQGHVDWQPAVQAVAVERIHEFMRLHR